LRVEGTSHTAIPSKPRLTDVGSPPEGLYWPLDQQARLHWWMWIPWSKQAAP